ncbi:MAG: response regulator, partial [Acidimicrobiia bacterium]
VRATPFIAVAVFTVLVIVKRQLTSPQLMIDELQRSRLGTEHARRHLALVAQGTQALMASPEDERAALRALVGVMVPEFADWCAVDVVQDGEINRLASAHSRPEVDAGVPGLLERLPTWTAAVGRVMAAGRSELDWLVKPDLVRHPGEEDHWSLLEALDLESWMIVPMVIQGLSVGAITCGTAPGRRGFRPSDVSTVEELASRTSVAVERIALYRETRLAADENAALYETVRAGEQRLRTLVEAAPLAVLEFAADGALRQGNSAARELLGGAGGDAPDGAIAFHPDTEAVLRQVVVDTVAGHPVADAEAVARRGDGTEVALSLFGAPLRHSGGIVDGVLVLAADITARRRLEEQLVRARRIEAVGQVAGGVAHDFNNLLTVILGHASLLDAVLGEGDARRDDVEAISLAAERAAGITSQLLTISRGDLVSSDVFDPRARLGRLGDTLRSLLGSSVALAVEVAPGDGLVRMSPAQFDQVILNLAVNARDALAGQAAGSLTVRMFDVAPEEVIVLEMADTGAGMDAGVAERCFEPFFTTKGGLRGTGLGLATVHSVVTGAGGEVSVVSEVGRGTTFTVRLPLVAGVAPAPSAPEQPAAAARSERVLVVENEDGLRRLAVEVLRSAGYVVTPAADGQAALEVVAREVPDLVVTDVVMPRMGGVELTRRLASEHPGVPVLFMTGYVDRDSRDQLQGAEVLVKPFGVDELVARVGEMLDGSRRGVGASESPGPSQGSKR